MMDLENGVFLEQVEDLAAQRRWSDLRDMLTLLEPADIAVVLAELSEGRLPVLYRLLPKELAAEVFVEMEPEEQEVLIKSFSDTELREVLEELYVDDTVDLIEEMPATVVKRILRHTDPETRRSVNEILQYPEDSAGSIMDAHQPALLVHHRHGQKVVPAQVLGHVLLVVHGGGGDDVGLHDVLDDVLLVRQNQGADGHQAQEMAAGIGDIADVDGLLVGARAADALDGIGYGHVPLQIHIWRRRPRRTLSSWPPSPPRTSPTSGPGCGRR